MSEMPVYTPEQEVERARTAQQVLENEIFKEACQRIEEGLAAQRQRVPIRETEMHTRLILMEQIWVQLKDYIQDVAITGRFAQDVIKERETREKSLLERILSGNFRN